MIKKIFIVLCLALSVVSMAKACDACGCTASGLGIGLMSDYRSNFVRVSYFDTRFASSPEHGHHNSSDVFTQVNLSFRYAFARLPKLRIIGHLPFAYNQRDSPEGKRSIKGLSDAKLLFNYTLFNTTLNKKSTLYVEAGGGLSIPTGKYKAGLHKDENLPENFNIGNGSMGYIFQINAAFNHDKWGVVLNQNYQLNGKTKQDYHFGNQLSSQLTVFREFNIQNDWKLVPNAGVFYENIASDAYQNGNDVPETGGKGVFFSSALNIKSERWLAGASYTIPMSQTYSSGVIDAKNRLAIHVSFLF